MSALPTGLILVPEVTELGMSVATVALADTSAERRAGLLDMWRTIEVLRRVRDSIRSEYSGTTGTDFPQASTRDLMTVMESAREAEEVYTDFYEMFYNVVRKPKFRAMVESHPDLTPFTLTDLHDFLDQWKVDFLPLVRRIRMSCILEIYRRAASLGIAGTGLGADFPQLFLAASLEEADAWQETAHLLADPGNASFLLRSMGSVASDKTEELFGLAEGP